MRKVQSSVTRRNRAPQTEERGNRGKTGDSASHVLDVAFHGVVTPTGGERCNRKSNAINSPLFSRAGAKYAVPTPSPGGASSTCAASSEPVESRIDGAGAMSASDSSPGLEQNMEPRSPPLTISLPKPLREDSCNMPPASLMEKYSSEYVLSEEETETDESSGSVSVDRYNEAAGGNVKEPDPGGGSGEVERALKTRTRTYETFDRVTFDAADDEDDPPFGGSPCAFGWGAGSPLSPSQKRQEIGAAARGFPASTSKLSATLPDVLFGCCTMNACAGASGCDPSRGGASPHILSLTKN